MDDAEKIAELDSENARLMRDLISARREAEGLRQQLVTQKTATESTGTAVAVVDWEMTILDGNEAVTRLTGKKLDQLVGRHRWSDFVHPDDRDRLTFYHQLRRENPEKAPPSYEFRIRDVSGTTRNVLINVQHIPGTAKLVATMQDISLQKQTEQALRDSEEKYRALFENSIELIFVHDFEGRFIDANDRALEVLGYRRHEIADLDFSHFLDGEDLARAAEIVATVYSRGAMSGPQEIMLTTRKGRPIWLEIASARIDREGEPYAVVGVARDVTQRKRAERALRESEERFRAMFNHAREMIFLYDVSGRFLDMNQKCLDTLQCTRDDIPKLRLQDMMAPEEVPSFMDGIEKLFRKGESIGPREWRIRLPDGRRMWVETTAVRMDLGGGVHAGLAIARDVTEKKRAELELAEARSQLQSAQRLEAVGRLAAGVAHEFNNLLSVVSGHCDLALDSLDERDPLHESMTEILTASERGSRLTRQLLAFGEKQVMRPTTTTIEECVQGILPLLERVLGENVDLVTRMTPSPGTVRVDTALIEQVVVDLAVRGKDAMPDGGSLIIETGCVDLDEEYTRTHRDVHPGPYVMLAVTDTGRGLAPDAVEHVFEPFYDRGDGAQDSGLGLASVYGIVHQSGGHVLAYSEPDRGTTFKIYLPRVDGPPSQASEEAETPPGGEETLLVVEDDDMVRRLVSRILALHGYRIIEARDGREGLEVIAENADVALVVTDVIMPVMSGKALADEIEKVRPGLPVVFMSGYPYSAIEHIGIIDAGMPFLGKPVSASKLLSVVRETLDGR